MKLLFDIETNDIDFSTGYWLDQVHTVHCIVIKDLDTGKVFRYYDTDGLRIMGTSGIELGIKQLEQADEWHGHNIIAFDIPVLEKLYRIKRAPRIVDSLVVSRLQYPDRQGGHSLESYGQKLGLPKLDAPRFTEFSPSMLTYCERDVELNARVIEYLKRERLDGSWEQALELEHRIAEIIAEQERVGFHFDTAKATQYLHEWQSEIQDIDERLTQMFPPRIEPLTDVKKPFNINGSLSATVKKYCEKAGLDHTLVCGPFQTVQYKTYSWESKTQQKAVLERLGWQPVNFTPTGSPKLDESILQAGEVGSLLMRRNVLSHRRSQLQGWISSVDQHSRIHAGANTLGTNTSRMRHKTVVNVPRITSDFGKEMRGVFGVPPGKILAGYDAKQLELRMLAHYIGDQEYVGRVTTTDKSRDAHTLAAQAAGSGDRDLGKGINYALIYGAGDPRLGALVGGTREDGERIRAAIYALIPGLERLVRAAKEASRRGYLIGLDGRKLFIRDNRTSALNTLIQGGGAIYMKRVTEILDQYGSVMDGWHKVLDMHDEAQWEIPDTEYNRVAFEQKVRLSFEKANEFYNLRCPQEPDVKFGYDWSATH